MVESRTDPFEICLRSPKLIVLEVVGRREESILCPFSTNILNFACCSINWSISSQESLSSVNHFIKVSPYIDVIYLVVLHWDLLSILVKFIDFLLVFTFFLVWTWNFTNTFFNLFDKVQEFTVNLLINILPSWPFTI